MVSSIREKKGWNGRLWAWEEAFSNSLREWKDVGEWAGVVFSNCGDGRRLRGWVVGGLLTRRRLDFDGDDEAEGG